MKLGHKSIPVALVLVFVLAPLGSAFADRRHHDRDHRSYRGGRYHYGGSRYYPAYRWYRPALSFTYVRRPVYYDDYGTAYRGRSIEAEVQIALAKRGYYRGPIDGDIGPGSRAAIRAWQVDRGLRVTGWIDRDLLRSLKL
jgi:hypothetical protein